MRSKFERIDKGYAADALETSKQLQLGALERSENDRLIQLLRTQNEVLTTQRAHYSDKVAELETQTADKD